MYKDKRILAIIPARGGSKGIPRKNVRFLNRNPLIAYIINTSKSSKYIDKTIVTTDDEEIGNISRIFGADEIIDRPTKLADDMTTLDPVIFHAYKTYKDAIDEDFDIIITLQPTSPLLTYQSLDLAISKFVDNNNSTMISVIPKSHLFWEKKEGSLNPYYPKRLNRQQLDPVYFETGGFVISKSEIVTEETRMAEPLDIFELSELEGIDIDNYLDWSIAEAILSRKKILIRVDGDHEIGMGHIYRTITLAKNLLEHDVLFVIKKDSKLGLDKVLSNNFKVKEIEKEEELSGIIESEEPDIVFIDILDTEKSYLEKIKSNNLLLVSFEDLGGGIELADLVINAVFTSKYDDEFNHVFSGYKYLCLRDEFNLVPIKPVSKEVKNLLITFGGIDQNNLSDVCLKIVKKLDLKNIDITVIVGLGYQQSGDLQKFAQTLNEEGFKIRVLKDVKLMSQHMYKTDLAITSNGRTVYEFASLGVPCISIAQNERETHHPFPMESEGVLYLGRFNDSTAEDLTRAVSALLEDYSKRQKMNEAQLRFDLRRGVKRVLRLIFDKYEEKYPSNILNIPPE